MMNSGSAVPVGWQWGCLALAWALMSGSVGAAAPARAPKPMTGVVTQVIDGQTLVVQPSERGAAALRVQLQGLEAPEPCQGGAAQARDALAQRVERKTVQLVQPSSPVDKAGTVRAKVIYKGQDVGATLVSEGWAWHQGSSYLKEERQAVAGKRGVHAAKKAMTPAEFRRHTGPCQGFAPGSARMPASAASRSEPEWLDPPTEERINNGSSLSY